MSFEEADALLAAGKSVARTGWDHEGAKISLLPEETVVTQDGARIHFPERYVMKIGSRELLWDRSDEDLRAWDWCEVN